MSTKKSYKYVVIIPTCARPHIEFKYLRLLKCAPESTLFIYSINPVDYNQAKSTFNKMESIRSYAEMYYQKTYNVVCLWEDKATSFGEACNKGYEYVRENCKDVECITFLNDDVDVTKNWQQKMLDCLRTDVFFTNTILAEDKKGISVNELPLKIGMVGPLANNVGSSQRIKPDPNLNEEQMNNKIYSMSQNKYGQTKNLFTSFLSGFCLMCDPDMLNQIYEQDGFIFDPIYKIGGFEDNDLIVRARILEWGCLIDQSTYLAHDGSLTLTNNFPESNKGMKNHHIYLEKWQSFTQKKQKIIGAYRVAIFTINNLAQMGSSLRVNHKFLDGAAILLTNNPANSLQAYDKELFERLRYEDQEFLVECKDITDPEELAERFKKWILFQTHDDFDVVVECWDFNKSLNERDERNYNYQMSVDMGADWIISIDSDECFEDRLVPKDIRKLSNNPDPLSCMYTFGWLNHYESMNVIRNDYPFCMGWKSGMNGVRMWRVWGNKHFPIVAGNEVGFHCGNAPEYGAYTLVGTDIRFRHLSMVREIDRSAKTSFYNNTDQDKDQVMIGNDNYNHIKRSQNVPITLYRRKNGIGVFNLSYDKEIPIFVAEKVRHFFGLSHHLIVWTSQWNQEDMAWLNLDVKDFPSEQEWRTVFPTGPCRFTAIIGKLHQVTFIYHSIEDGLDECRNAALKYYKENFPQNIGWAMYIDPDEFVEGFHPSEAISCYRRMAEATDAIAFKFKFKNISNLRNGKSHISISESMRLIKLENYLPIYFYGKAHETLEKSLKEISSMGHSVIIENCPMEFVNSGLYLSPEEIAAKLQKYQNLLINTLNENPYSSASWTSLGMSYEQDEDEKNAEICYERACLTAGTAFLPFQSLGLFYARKAVGLFYAAMIRTQKVPSLNKQLKDTFSKLRELVGEFPIIDDGNANISAKFDLPQFPYDKIVYDEKNNQIVRKEESDDIDSNEGLQ